MAYKSVKAKLKEELATATHNLEVKERELARIREEEKKRAEEAKKRHSMVVYCGNCQRVRSVSIPPGVKLEDGDCIYCRCRGFQKQVIDDEGRF